MTGPGYRWAVIGLLRLVCVLNYVDRQAIFPVFPAQRAEPHLTDVQLGLVGGAFMWVYAAALPLAGMVADRASRKAVILGGLVAAGTRLLYPRPSEAPP